MKKIVKIKLNVILEIDGEDEKLTLIKNKKARKIAKKIKDKNFQKLDEASKLAREIKMLVEDGQAINLRLEMQKDSELRKKLIEEHDEIRAKLKVLHSEKDVVDAVEIDFDLLEKDVILSEIDSESHKTAKHIAEYIGWVALGEIIAEFWKEDKEKK